METVIDQAGRIVLPKPIRGALGLLPGVARLAPADAARLLNARFAAPLLLSGPRTRKPPATLSRPGIAGGAVNDALVALAAQEHAVDVHDGRNAGDAISRPNKRTPTRYSARSHRRGSQRPGPELPGHI